MSYVGYFGLASSYLISRKRNQYYERLIGLTNDLAVTTVTVTVAAAVAAEPVALVAAVASNVTESVIAVVE